MPLLANMLMLTESHRVPVCNELQHSLHPAALQAIAPSRTTFICGMQEPLPAAPGIQKSATPAKPSELHPRAFSNVSIALLRTQTNSSLTYTRRGIYSTRDICTSSLRSRSLAGWWWHGCLHLTRRRDHQQCRAGSSYRSILPVRNEERERADNVVRDRCRFGWYRNAWPWLTAGTHALPW